MADRHPAALKIEKRKQVQDQTGLSRSGMYDKISKGEFPAPIQLGVHSVGRLAHEVDAWIEQRV
ncbi:MAG TPA: AlpA family phage regulatory protein [Gammaproteobacteria bacterium]|nr:AlpA family phage regulatory protein [Gammaproteobacteria bacterium]